MGRLIRFGISMDGKLLEKFDKIISQKGYSNRSEAIRDMVRDNLVAKEWAVDNKNVVGTVTLIYNHHSYELADKLTDLQHHNYKNIISTTHIHLDEHNCLEILALKGKGKKVKEIADKLIATKGVKHGKLVMTSTGKELS